MAAMINRASQLYLKSILTHSSRILCSTTSVRYNSDKQSPMMLMNLPRIVYPNLFHTFKNFFSRILISGYFDPTFSIKSFSDGARQALTVVSRLIGNNQFEDLSELVSKEALDEIKQNYQRLSTEQKQKIAVDESEIVFAYPYLIGMIMDEQASSRLVEITMIFHVLKDRNSFQDDMFQSSKESTNDWTTRMRKMRENIVVCNYKFLRDMSKSANDDSWTITGLNHWLPSEYDQQSSQQ